MSSEAEGLEVKCPNCGATLGAATAGAVYTCGYCGHRSATPFAARPVAPPPAPRPATRVRPAEAPRASFVTRYAWVAIVLVSVVPLVVGLVVAFRSSGLFGAGGGIGGPSYSWALNGQPPVLAKVAGGQVVVGRLYSGNNYYVGAFDAATGKKRWKVGPFDKGSNAYTDFAVSGSHVVVVDVHAKAHIYDLATGKEQHAVALTDTVGNNGSVWPLAKDQVVIKQADERTTILDLSTGRGSIAPKSKYSYPSSDQPCGTNELENLPRIPGFRPECRFKSDRMTVVSGRKSPGREIPMVVGLEPGAKAPKWELRTPVVDVATLNLNGNTIPAVVHGDRFVGLYLVNEKGWHMRWHMTAVDTRTGTRQWDVKLGAPPPGAINHPDLLLSSNRVFVVNDTLELYDAATGKLVASIGRKHE